MLLPPQSPHREVEQWNMAGNSEKPDVNFKHWVTSMTHNDWLGSLRTAASSDFCMFWICYVFVFKVYLYLFFLWKSGWYAVVSVRWRASAISLDHPLFQTSSLPIHKQAVESIDFLCFYLKIPCCRVCVSLEISSYQYICMRLWKLWKLCF